MLLGCLQARSRPHSLDADLGLRLARCGERVGMIAPSTLEAPLEQMGVWLAQRSRWLKGFLQTWLVLMCTPAASIWEMELTGFVSMQLALGAAILSAVVHGPCGAFYVFACRTCCSVRPGQA